MLSSFVWISTLNVPGRTLSHKRCPRERASATVDKTFTIYLTTNSRIRFDHHHHHHHESRAFESFRLSFASISLPFFQAEQTLSTDHDQRWTIGDRKSKIHGNRPPKFGCLATRFHTCKIVWQSSLPARYFLRERTTTMKDKWLTEHSQIECDRSYVFTNRINRPETIEQTKRIGRARKRERERAKKRNNYVSIESVRWLGKSSNRWPKCIFEPRIKVK